MITILTRIMTKNARRNPAGVGLIVAELTLKRFDRAAKASKNLLTRYPDSVSGTLANASAGQV